MPDQIVHPEASRSPFNFGGWDWSEPQRGEHFRRCSFCGSINPDDLAAEDNWVAQWADQKYGWPHKFYVDIPNHDPFALFVVSRTTTEPTAHERENGWIATADLTEEQTAIIARDGWAPSEGPRHAYWLFGKRPMHHGKFYSVHLRDTELDPVVKNTIEQRSGLAFTFEGGTVSWRSLHHDGTQ